MVLVRYLLVQNLKIVLKKADFLLIVFKTGFWLTYMQIIE